MTVDPKLLDLIRCPLTRQPVASLASDRLERLNELISANKIKARDDTPVTDELAEALVTEDGNIAYPVIDGFPVMMEEHGIQLSQLDVA